MNAEILAGPGPLGWGLPAGLWGLLALGVPLAVHLLVRTRAPRVPVATLRFFRPRAPARTRLTPPRDRWLLALRLTLVALAALALSDPWLRASSAEVRGEEEVAEGALAPDRGATAVAPAEGGPPPGAGTGAAAREASQGGVEGEGSQEGVSRGDGPVQPSGPGAPGQEHPPAWPGPRGWGELEASHPQVVGVLERLGVPLPRLGRGAGGLAQVAALHRLPEGAGTLGPQGSPWLEEGGAWTLEGGAVPGAEADPARRGEAPRVEARRVEPAMDRFQDAPGTALFLQALAGISLRSEPTSRPSGSEAEGPEVAAEVREREAEALEGEAAAPEEGEESFAPEEDVEDPRPLRRLAWGAVLLLLLVEGKVRGGGGTAPGEARQAPGGGR